MLRLGENAYWAMGLVLLPAAAYVAVPEYFSVVILMYYYAALGSAWNILGGRTGQLSFGNSAFLAVGAYTSTLLFLDYHVSPWVGMWVGGALAAVTSLLLGLTSLRLKGPFFVMSSFAFVQVVQLLLAHFTNITNGNVGLVLPLTDSLADMESGNPLFYGYLIAGILLLAVSVNYAISKSKTGYFLSAIREDEDAAKALGVNTARYKALAFVTSAFLTALIGTFYAQYLLFITPTATASIPLSIQIAIIAIVGGRELWAPVLGGIMLEGFAFLVETLFPAIPGLNFAVYAVLLMAVIILSPSGVYKYVREHI
ncbi:MAG: branched-chain amino acid ABC transporter permease [Nitrososphaerota archaeon]|nr:branched-chain amino acid ABC transporter permease [Nitrososphaerota archaeon]